MRMDRLLEGLDLIEVVGETGSAEVLSVTEDSRRVRSGSLYCCVTGLVTDGHAYAEQAIRSGAVGLLCERKLPVSVPQAVVAAVRPAMAEVASTFHGRPSEHLAVIGVTGTNGKTTVTHMLRAVLEAHGWPTGLFGTLTGTRTTASAPELQAALATSLREGSRAVAMEVSSHALTQHRVDAVRFAAAVFTNLSQDHLDYHGTMEAYFEAKAGLFQSGQAAVSVINVSGPWGRRLASMASDPVLTYSAEDARDVESGLAASRFRWRSQLIALPLGGLFNIENALAAATTASALGVADETIASGLSALAPVRGRMELIRAGQQFEAVVDFAHTPDGLEHILASARQGLEGGRVAVVFGCGGNRDHSKRPLMGAIASRLADLAVITSDNPRDEDPLEIIGQIRSGMDGRAEVVVDPDRASAIALALGRARPGDVVIVAGKGHETGQETAGVTRPFDDAAVVREWLEHRGEGR